MAESGSAESGTPESSSSVITIKVVDHRDGEEVSFQLPKTMSFRRLMNKFCEFMENDRGFFTFVFEGKVLGEDQTPQKVAMEDLDEITAFVHCHGGGRI